MCTSSVLLSPVVLDVLMKLCLFLWFKVDSGTVVVTLEDPFPRRSKYTETPFFLFVFVSYSHGIYSVSGRPEFFFLGKDLRLPDHYLPSPEPSSLVVGGPSLKLVLSPSFSVGVSTRRGPLLRVSSLPLVVPVQCFLFPPWLPLDVSTLYCRIVWVVW